MATAKIILRKLGLALGVMTLAACDFSDGPEGTVVTPIPPPPPPAMATLEVTVSNLTNAQPLSPVAVVAHGEGYNVFTIGDSASIALERLAEAGDNSDLLADADANTFVLATASGAAPIGPGGNETIRIEVLESELANLRLSTMTMLVNTNDAVSGLRSIDVSALAVGDRMMLRSVAYDAGTEANTETAATIPGPAGGGEGFNAIRDDHFPGFAMHTGVVSASDGLTGSDLTEAHRFDNPVVGFTVERIQ